MAAAAFLIGAAWTIDLPARNALVPDLLGKAQTVDAILLESIVQGIVSSSGALFAGWLLARAGPETCIGVLICLTAVNVILLYYLAREKISQTKLISGQSVWSAIGEGMQYIRPNQPILTVTLISAILNTLIFPSMSLLPVFARDVLDRGPMGLGLLNAGYSIGTFSGLFAVHRLRHTMSIGWIFAAGALVECVALVLFATSTSYRLSWWMLFCAGIGQAGFRRLKAGAGVETA
jgi:Na+/melibiose symporter-like transporter